jgi:excisionase family DNA binding protein
VGSKYGLEIASFIVENVSVPPEVEQAIDKRSSMAAIGNLNDYVKYQMARAWRPAAAAGGDGDGARRGVRHRAADHAAVGRGAHERCATGCRRPGSRVRAWRERRGRRAGAAVAGGGAGPDLLGVPEVAGLLGVTEADVLAVLEGGELKGRKIGSTWRVRRAAVDEYLAG